VIRERGYGVDMCVCEVFRGCLLSGLCEDGVRYGMVGIFRLGGCGCECECGFRHFGVEDVGVFVRSLCVSWNLWGFCTYGPEVQDRDLALECSTR
jgi:hypothetical protein